MDWFSLSGLCNILLILLKFYQCNGIRRFTTQVSDINVVYGYANMVAHTGYILDVVPLQTITINITSSATCIAKCINVDKCNSLNVIGKLNGQFDCQLLNTDRFRSHSNFVTQTGTTHYAINHDCEWEETCINPNHKCIPHYNNATYECICPSFTYDEYCMFELTDNMALNKEVTMSQTLYIYKGSFCTDGIFGQGCSFCHTNTDVPSWIRVDLGSLKIITYIIIHNRYVPGQLEQLERLSNTDIYVFNNQDPNDNRRLCTHIEDGATLELLVRCNKPLLARNVELHQLGTGRVMNLCEIMVY